MLKFVLVLIILFCLAIGVLLAITPPDNRNEAIKSISDFANSKVPVRAECKKQKIQEDELNEPGIPLLDEGGIRITITSMDKSSEGFLYFAPEFTLKIENTTSSTKYVMAPFAKLNGYQFETLLSAEIAPGETIYDQTMRLYSPVDFIDYGFTSLDELYVWFNILDENYDRYLIPEATLKLSEEASEYSHDESGTVTYDADGLKVIVRDTISRDGKKATVYVSNLSDNYYYPVPAQESVDGLLTIEPTLEKYGIFTDPQTADCLLYYRDVPEE